MSWPKVIVFAVITAVYTALINQAPFLCKKIYDIPSNITVT